NIASAHGGGPAAHGILQPGGAGAAPARGRAGLLGPVPHRGGGPQGARRHAAPRVGGLRGGPERAHPARVHRPAGGRDRARPGRHGPAAPHRAAAARPHDRGDRTGALRAQRRGRRACARARRRASHAAALAARGGRGRGGVAVSAPLRPAGRSALGRLAGPLLVLAALGWAALVHHGLGPQPDLGGAWYAPTGFLVQALLDSPLAPLVTVPWQGFLA